MKSKNKILEIRVKGDKKKKLNKLCNYYSHARNMLRILINKNFGFFLNIGINDWNLNLLFTDRIYNRGDNQKKLELKNLFENELLTNDLYVELISKLKEFKCNVGNSIFQSLLRDEINNYNSYFKSLEEYNKDPDKFNGKPGKPKPKKLQKVNNCCVQLSRLNFITKKTDKGNIIEIKISKLDKELHGISNKNNNTIKFKLPDYFKDKLDKISSVRIVKKLDDIYLQIIYKDEIKKEKVNKNNKYVAGIDPGLDNLLTIVTNHPLLSSFLISGKEVKSFNQWYNKLKAELQSENKNLDRRKLERYRFRRIKSIFHQISSKLIELFVEYGISEVIIGKNVTESKQNINLGKKNNQNFNYIPHSLLFEMIKYKCEDYGIKVREVDESYTSKCSSLSDDFPEKKDNYNGKRIKRGFFKDKALNKVFNADCNGALNIIKKVKKNIINTLPLNVWIDKLSRPVRIYLKDIMLSFEHFIEKVSRESTVRWITGSIGEPNKVLSCHEVPCQVL